jgi:hypothetical protein
MRGLSVARNGSNERAQDARKHLEEAERRFHRALYDGEPDDAVHEATMAFFFLGRLIEATHGDLNYDYNQAHLREMADDLMQDVKRLAQKGAVKTNGRRR